MAPKSSSSSSSKKQKSTDPDSSSTKTSKQPKLPTEYILRPSKNVTLKTTGTIYISPKLLKLTGLKKSQFIKVSKGLVSLTGELSIWTDAEEDEYDMNVVLISGTYLQSVGFLYGDRVKLLELPSQPEYATNLVVESLDGDEKKARENVSDLGILFSGLTTDDLKITYADSASSKSEKALEDYLSELSLTEPTKPSSAAGKKAAPLLFHPKTTKLTIRKVNKIEPVELPYSYSKIGGLDKELSKLQQLLQIPLYHPEILTQFRRPPPRGILLHGPSGTGKSLILKSIAYELSLKCHIININGPSIVSKYLGGTEEALRGYFEEAEKYQPSVILIDEIDSLVPNRNNDDTTEVDSRVVATLAMLLDGLTGSVVVIGATNRINNIDTNLRRRGRFDKEVAIPVPDADARFDILSRQFKDMSDAHELSNEQIKAIAGKTHGYVGSDLDSLLDESIMKCVNRRLEGDLESKVTDADVEESLTDIVPIKRNGGVAYYSC
ncbi:unnamed protein product [Ambrosiozyma monospora]|uniref:Unnamed protein product n=1 Tax=Ambrosiozyma monospora TaxID=43982 RepID=A0ACB5T9F8_AMBMO|nr:unnamed protein product [Ambrosiozyma monospora]